MNGLFHHQSGQPLSLSPPDKRHSVVVSCMPTSPDASKEPTYHTFIQNGANTNAVDTVDARPLSLNGDAFGQQQRNHHRPAFMRRSVHRNDETENVFRDYGANNDDEEEEEDDEDDEDDDDDEEESNEHNDAHDEEYMCEYNPCGDEIISVAAAAAAAEKSTGAPTAQLRLLDVDA